MLASATHGYLLICPKPMQKWVQLPGMLHLAKVLCPARGCGFVGVFSLTKKLSVKLSLLESVLLTSEKSHFRLNKGITHLKMGTF